MTQCFPSRRSLILGILIWGIVFAVLYLYINILINNFNWLTFLVIFLIFSFLFLLIGTIWLRTRYIIKDDVLIIKIGPVTFANLPVREIYSIRRTWTILSAPANSLKRILITYSDGHAVISPAREKEFIKLLLTINPGIRVKIP